MVQHSGMCNAGFLGHIRYLEPLWTMGRQSLLSNIKNVGLGRFRGPPHTFCYFCGHMALINIFVRNY